MKTRFENSKTWFGHNATYDIEEMSTNHLINTLNMLCTKPLKIMGMLIDDIEDSCVFDPDGYNKKISLNNVTSMSESELIDYVLNSNVVKAIVTELLERNVNVEKVMSMVLKHGE